MTHINHTLFAHAELAGEKNNIVIPKLYIEFCDGDINAGIVMREIVGLYAWSCSQEKIDSRQPNGFYRDDKDWKNATYLSRRQVNRGIDVIESKVKELLGDDYEPLIAKKIAKPIVGKEGDELIYASSVATFYTVNSRIYDKAIQLFRKSHVGAVLPDVSERYDQNGTTGTTEKVDPSITTQLTNTTDRHNGSSGDEEGAPENQPPSIDEMFEQFWAAYPKPVKGRSVRQATLAKFRVAIKKTSLQELLDAIEWWKQTDKWRKNCGEFVDGAQKWLNQEMWRDASEGSSPEASRKVVRKSTMSDEEFESAWGMGGFKQ